MAGPVRHRGASPGGRRKLPPKGGARRTASIPMAEIFGRLFEFLGEQTSFMRERDQAELESIRQRTNAGMWTAADLKRLQTLQKKYVRVSRPRKK